VGIFVVAVAIGVATAAQELVLLAAVALLPFAVLYPVQTGIGLLAFLIPFDSVLMVREGMTLNWVIGAVAGGLLLISGLVNGRLQMPPKPALWWGLLLAWSAMTVLWAADTAEATQQLQTAATLFMLYLAAASFRVTRAEFSHVILLTILGGTVAAGYTVGQFLQQPDGRATIAFAARQANPNDFASSLLLPLSLTIAGFLAARKLSRQSAMLTAGAVMALGIFLTMSRGALFALCVMALVYAVRNRLQKRYLVPAAMIAFLLMLVPQEFFLRLSEAAASRAGGRLDIWLVGLEIVKHHGLFGAGVGNFEIAYQQFAGFATVFRGFSRAPHSVYLQVAAELGVVGLVLLAGAVVSHLKRLRRAIGFVETPDSLLVGIEAACIALLAHGLVMNLLWRKSFWMAWIFLLWAVRLRASGDDRQFTRDT
jgi:O-antigen ligase